MRSDFRATSRTALASAALLLALAACSSPHGEDSAGSTPLSGSVSIPPVAAAAKLVPVAVRSKGTLIVGMEAQYPPFESIADDNSTIIGLDADIAKAIGAALDLKVTLINTSFESIIPGLQGGKYDLGISAFTDTQERERVVDFVTYFSEGQMLMVQAGNPDHLDINNLCGKTIGIGKGGTEELLVIPALSKKCEAGGQPPINAKVFNGQDAPNLAVSSGQVQGTVLDQTVGVATAKASNGKFEVVGDPIYKSAVGIAIPKPSGMTNAVHTAVQALIDNGTYKKLLDTWNVQAGAIATSQVNVAGS